MPIDPNLALLEMTHSILSISMDGQNSLKQLVEESKETGTIPMTIEFAAALQHLLAVQSNLITGLTEQNQQNLDNVTALVNRLESR